MVAPGAARVVVAEVRLRSSLGIRIEAKRDLLATHKKFVLPNTTSDTFSLNTDANAIALRMYQTQDANPREYRLNIAPFTDPIPDGMQFLSSLATFIRRPDATFRR
jgi:hypothetical protein